MNSPERTLWCLVVFEHLCRQFLKYGNSGGSDDALNAVADITTLSESAGRRSKDSHHSERRTKREISDLIEPRSESLSPQRSQQQQTGSRVPNGAPFPPPVPASIANDLEDRSFGGDDDDNDEDDFDDSLQRGGSRYDRNRGKAYEGRDSDDEEREHRRPSPAEDETRVDQRPKPKVRRDTAAPFADKSQHPAESKNDRFHAAKRAEDRLSKSSRPTHGALAEQEEGDEEQDILKAAEETNSSGGGAVGGDADRDQVVDPQLSTASSAAAIKLQPSKRRTNGKKRQSVPECTLS